MTGENDAPRPDFRDGFALEGLPDGGSVLGRVDTEDAILVRQGDQLFAVGAHCTHYHGPLAEGLVVDETVRCPWHHACFSLRTGEALRAPALDPIPCWRVERVGDLAYVREKVIASGPHTSPPSSRSGSQPESVVIIGGGGAGLAAAEMLRRGGYDGSLTMLSADDSPPTDRPNLSKDFLAGTAKDEWIPLQAAEFYTERRIDLVLNARVSSLDTRKKLVQLETGKTLWLRRRADRDRRRACTTGHSGRDGVTAATTSERSRIAEPSSPGRHRRRPWWSWDRASSAWRSPRRCERAGSRCMWSRLKPSRWNGSWGRRSGARFDNCTRSTAWSFIRA